MSNLLVGRLPGHVVVPVSRRVSFLYLSFGRVSRESNSVVFSNSVEVVDLPVGVLSCLLLGSGTSITQEAVAEAIRFNCGVSFVYGGGVGCHANFLSGSTRNARLLLRQANLHSVPSLRFEVAKLMYSLRWGDAYVPEAFNMRELMGFEGRRMRDLYVENFRVFGIDEVVPREGVKAFADSHPLNQHITSLYQVLYGLANTVVLSLGLSPGLGFIHQGNSLAFVFDLADLYKEEFLPVAFRAYSEGKDSGFCRAYFRDSLLSLRLMERIVDDVFGLLELNGVVDEGIVSDSPSVIWDNTEGEGL